MGAFEGLVDSFDGKKWSKKALFQSKALDALAHSKTHVGTPMLSCPTCIDLEYARTHSIKVVCPKGWEKEFDKKFVNQERPWKWKTYNKGGSPALTSPIQIKAFIKDLLEGKI